MRRPKPSAARRLLLILAALCLTAWSTAFFLIRAQTRADDTVIPTLMVLPSLTPTQTASPTLPPTLTPTPTATLTLTPTTTASSTPIPTLSACVLTFTVVMPGVVLPPQPTDLPYGLTVLYEPPQPVEPLPDATNAAPPFVGWYAFESDYPTVRYAPPWTPRLAPFASRGQYHRTEGAYDTASFTFEGAALQVRYVAAQNMGMFEVVVDGVVLETIDAYADELTFPTTDVYFVGDGTHRLEIRAVGRRNSASSGVVVGLDAVHIWRGDAHTWLVTPAPLPTASPTPRPVCPANTDEMRRLASYEALIEFRDDAIENGILTQAQTQGEVVLSNFMRALTGKDVEIEFRPAAALTFPQSCVPEPPTP